MKKQYGLPRANKDALADNFVKETECKSCGDYTVCEDVLTGSTREGATVTSFTYNGEVYDLDTPIPVTDTAKIESAISLEIEKMEVNTKVEAKHENGELTITHIGAYPLELVVAGVDLTATRNCTVVSVNCYKTSATLTSSEVIVNGTSATLANSAYDAYDDASAATFKTDLEAALSELTVKNVSVTAEADYFSVEICVVGSASISIDGKSMVWCESYTEYQ